MRTIAAKIASLAARDASFEKSIPRWRSIAWRQLGDRLWTTRRPEERGSWDKFLVYAVEQREPDVGGVDRDRFVPTHFNRANDPATGTDPGAIVKEEPK